MTRIQTNAIELLGCKQTGTQAIINIMIVISDLIGEVGQLRFKTGLGPLDKTLADGAELFCIG